MGDFSTMLRRTGPKHGAWQKAVSLFRHTALTWLAGCPDTYPLAKIAGHASITITVRYCHPQGEAVEQAFRKFTEGVPTK